MMSSRVGVIPKVYHEVVFLTVNDPLTDRFGMRILMHITDPLTVSVIRFYGPNGVDRFINGP